MYPALGPIAILEEPQVVNLPASNPRKILQDPDVTHAPLDVPRKTLSSPSFRLQPDLQPIAILRNVSASEAAPASVPAYKFCCASASNVVSVIVIIPVVPMPVATTPFPTKLRLVNVVPEPT